MSYYHLPGLRHRRGDRLARFLPSISRTRKPADPLLSKEGILRCIQQPRLPFPVKEDGRADSPIHMNGPTLARVRSL
jgi:hypothetical protein